MGKRGLEEASFRVTKDVLLPGVFFALFVRWCVAAYPYSGFRKPPKYGDYEAQRHWQEITVHTQLKDWYRNTTQNDLQYWGLDYPPLTAYHSYLIGIVGEWLEPESIRLFASRGYESDKHKTFMRWTVILSDLYIYFPVVLCLCLDRERVKPKEEKNAHIRTDFSTVLFLLYPGLILIDHGHFQYNCVSLGLFLWATFFLTCLDCDVYASICFMLALNYKQMELYHALPFFFYMLRLCLVPTPRQSKFTSFLNKLNRIVLGLFTIFILIWFPFFTMEDLKQVFIRLFPLDRGVFEDKVSNVWCVINVFIKLKTYYTNIEMAQYCLLSTVVAVLPPCLDIFFRCNRKKFVLCLINVSLGFFLFSYQVHEKSILLVAIPVALYLPYDPFICFWFLLVSSFSMFPLLLRDGLLIPFIATNGIYIAAYRVILKIADPDSDFISMFSANEVYKAFTPNTIKAKSLTLTILSTNFVVSCLVMVFYIMLALFMTPIPRYPDLIPLVISVKSCMHFLMFYFYFMYAQLSIPELVPTVYKRKLN